MGGAEGRAYRGLSSVARWRCLTASWYKLLVKNYDRQLQQLVFLVIRSATKSGNPGVFHIVSANCVQAFFFVGTHPHTHMLCLPLRKCVDSAKRTHTQDEQPNQQLALLQNFLLSSLLQRCYKAPTEHANRWRTGKKRVCNVCVFPTELLFCIPPLVVGKAV